uniref:Uncharacterized protein n=1 Tax=Latimeria chalumnae TaxID=7897 RepID=H3AX95_LATCH
NLQVSEFTFRACLHHSRTKIDFFLVSKSLMKSVRGCNLGLSDHTPVGLSLWCLEDLGRRGRWRMNIALLKSDLLRKEIEQIIKEFLELNVGSVEATATLWDAAKAYLRGRLIAISSRVKKARVQKEELVKELERREPQGGGEEGLQELLEAKFELNSIYHEKAKYALFRLRQNQYESGEKAGKLLVSLVWRREVQKWIPAIRLESGDLATDPRDISGAFLSFYEQLYSSDVSPDPSAYGRFLAEVGIPRLTQSEREHLDAPIPAAEVHSAIHSMQQGKSP